MRLELEEYLAPGVRARLHEAVAQILTGGVPARVIASVNQKGGAGKTTTAVTLAAVWASWGLPVRVLDCDPQYGSLTYWMPPQWPTGQGPDLRAVFFDEATLDEATAPTTVPGFDIVPSSKSLGQVEFAHSQIPDVNTALKAALAESDRHYPLTILDCRPSLGPLTLAALTAATEVLIPLGASGMDVPGLVELGETLATVRRRLNPGLPVATVVVCHDSDTLLSRDVREQLAEDYPDALHWRIRRSVRVEEAPFAHAPLTITAPTIAPTLEYVGLAAEMLIRGTR